MRHFSPTPVLLKTARGLILVALAVFVLLACRADEGLVGPVSLRAFPGDSVLQPGQTMRLTGVDLATPEAALRLDAIYDYIPVSRFDAARSSASHFHLQAGLDHGVEWVALRDQAFRQMVEDRIANVV